MKDVQQKSPHPSFVWQSDGDQGKNILKYPEKSPTGTTANRAFGCSPVSHSVFSS